MANGRSSVFRGAGIAAGKYSASQERGRGFEYQKSGAAALDSMNLQKMYETTGAIAEGIGLASSIVDSAYSKKELGKAVEGMKATEKKQGFGDWLVGAEKEYEMTDASGKKITRTASELKTDWGTRQATAVEEFKPEKSKVVKKDEKPTMLDEATQSKKPNWLSDDKGMIQGYTEDGKKKLRFGEEKGFDTKTKDWFQSLFKGGADKGFTGDNSTALDAEFDPSELPKELQNIGIVKGPSQVYGPKAPSGTKVNPYLGMSFSDAYGAASKSMGGQGTFWWQSEKGESKEYGF